MHPQRHENKSAPTYSNVVIEEKENRDKKNKFFFELFKECTFYMQIYRWLGFDITAYSLQINSNLNKRFKPILTFIEIII